MLAVSFSFWNCITSATDQNERVLAQGTEPPIIPHLLHDDMETIHISEYTSTQDMCRPSSSVPTHAPFVQGSLQCLTLAECTPTTSKACPLYFSSSLPRNGTMCWQLMQQ